MASSPARCGGQDRGSPPRSVTVPAGRIGDPWRRSSMRSRSGFGRTALALALALALAGLLASCAPASGTGRAPANAPARATAQAVPVAPEASGAPPGDSAGAVADFYRGKTLRLVVGFA